MPKEIHLARPWLLARDLIESINHGKSEQEVLDIIYRELQGIVPFDRIGVATLDPTGERLVMTSVRSDGPPRIDVGYAGRLKGSTLEPLLREQRVRIINDLEAYFGEHPKSDATHRILQEGMRSNLTLPLIARGRPIGVMFLSSRQAGSYRPAHEDLLREVAGPMAIAVENGLLMDELKRRNQQLEQQNVALRDADQLKSRFVEQLEKEVERRTHELQASYQEIERLKDQLQMENVYLKDEVSMPFTEIIGSSPVLAASLEAARKVALSDTTVLITGETGTGKELIARAIHNLSTRRGKALIRVSCSAIPETLIESELFGHEKGAFTGAVARKEGRFELASGGTLFLDEIGDVPPSVQVKLLRALQEREIERLGGTGPIRVDTRIIAATNRNLEAMVADGRFREDLYYRLNVFPIVVPPLRDRREDLPVLAEHFLKKHARRLHRRVTKITPKAMNLFLSYDWPGNVRELEHLIERAVILCEGDTLGIAHIDFSRRPHQFQAAVRGSASAPERLRTLEDVKRYGEQVEREFLRQTLMRSEGRIYGPGGAAETLGVKPTTLQSRLAKLGLSGRRAAGR